MTIFKKSTEFGSIAGLLALFVLAHFCHHLLSALPIPLLPLIRSDFGLDYTLSGLVISAFNLSYGIGQLPGGWLADRFGARLMVTIGICGVALAGFGVGLSQNFWMMIVFLALMGVLGGGYHPAAPPTISALVERKHRGRVLGMHMIGGGASFFLSPLVAAGIAAYWGWRGSFIGLAIPTLIFGIVFYVLLGKRSATASRDGASSPLSQESSPAPRRVRALVVFIFLSTFTHAILFSAMSFIPLFLVDRVGFGKETAGAFFAFIYSAGLWVGPLGGYLSDRFGPIPVVVTVLFLAGPVIFLLNFVSSWLGVGIVLLAIGIIIYVRMPVSEAYIISHTSERNRSTILGIYFFSGMEGGGVLTPVMGYMIDRLGFYTSFGIAGILLVSATFICYLLLRKTA
jgi:MFS family permease